MQCCSLPSTPGCTSERRRRRAPPFVGSLGPAPATRLIPSRTEIIVIKDFIALHLTRCRPDSPLIHWQYCDLDSCNLFFLPTSSKNFRRGATVFLYAAPLSRKVSSPLMLPVA